MKNRFIDGNMSRQGYVFSDWANEFFQNKQQFKYTFAQGTPESEALSNVQKNLHINETATTFKMTK
ncbi:MAG: hypothetical protein LBP53_00730 [Candidatus Peribacteria bacterium]|jgi:hypothetical protein|nr:hypothetical protein [Candidatus Peribacteria bacterium]